MLRHRTDPIAHPGWGMGWGMPHPALPRPGRISERTRWLWLVPLVASFLTVFGWVVAHDPGKGLALSNRGWLTIAVALLLLVLLGVHRLEGLGHLTRMVAEYAVVATLAVLLATAASTAPSPAEPEAKARAQAAARAAGACPPVIQVRAWLSCLWHQAANADQPPTTTMPGDRR
jgi:hypothetical protein